MDYICPHCGYEGRGKKCLRGSKTTELLIWTIVLIPGPFYSFWRRFRAPRRCLHCDQMGMVHAGSDAGFLAKAMLEKELESRPQKTDVEPQELPGSQNKKPESCQSAPVVSKTIRNKPAQDPNMW